MSRYDLRGESPLRAALRVGRTLLRSGLADDGAFFKLPQLAGVAATRGLDVRSLHTLHAVSHPHRLAVIDGERWVTAVELERLINQTVHMLAKHNVRPKDRVLICMENRLEYLLTWFALFRLGATAVHASYRSTPAELTYLREHSGARLVVGSGLTAPNVEHAGFERWICGDDTSGAMSFWALRQYPTTPFSGPTGADGDSIVYTSGTTGQPKGAVRKFTSFGVLELSRLLERLPLQATDRHLVVCPLYHSAAQAFVLLNAALGATVVLERHFDPALSLSRMRRLRITTTFLVPTMIRQILDLPQHERGVAPPLRCLVSGAAPFPHALRIQAAQYFGVGCLYDFYGATELGWVTLINGHEMMSHPGSVGRALSGQKLRVGSPESASKPYEIGPIWVSTGQVMSGYLHDDSADLQWSTVDDLGYLDPDGFLYLSGRDRDMVISGGVNVYPVEVEEALHTIPGVIEAAVVGVPDEKWGERVVAFVVGDVDVEALQSQLRNTLSGPKLPRAWHHVETLPRNATGKVLKKALRDEAIRRSGRDPNPS
ncbi:MAG: class I adenylate-forming enzyme family protein [bacterium]